MCDVNKTTRAITCGSTYARSRHYCKSTACIKDRHIRSHTSDICARQKRKSLTHLANPDPAPEAAQPERPNLPCHGSVLRQCHRGFLTPSRKVSNPADRSLDGFLFGGQGETGMIPTGYSGPVLTFSND